MAKYDRLLEPVKIGNLEIKNRIVMPPMATLSAEDGMPSEPMINYYAERAKGGTGMIIVEFTKCDTKLEPIFTPHHLRLDTEKHQQAFARLADAVHLNGSKIALQITIGLGSAVTRREAEPGYKPLGPTTFAKPGLEARPLTTEEVESLVQSSAAATVMAKDAGFDAVEIHGHSSYLLGQFMSPYVNTRTDKYGDLWRLPVELLEASKNLAGEDYPIIFRISGDEFIEGGRTIEGTIEICKRMEEAGIDCINVSNGTYYTLESNRIFPYMTLPRATYAPESKKIREAVSSVPLLLAGRLSDPIDALRIVEEGTADFIGIGRGLLADPEFVNKLAEGREDEIRPCMSCNYCVGSMMTIGCTVRCAVNARVFRESEFKAEPAEKRKKVIVIGGGPGGIEAARVAARRGHRVTLYEKEDHLGGYLPAAATPEHKKDIIPFLNWHLSDLEKSGADVVLNTEVSPELLSEEKPDAVIIAVGATLVVPEIPGVKGSNVVSAIDVLLNRVDTGDEVVVAGGGLVGCDVAMFLADKGRKVSIVEMLPDVVLDMVDGDGSRGQVMMLLAQKGITCHTKFKIEEITEKGVITCNQDGAMQSHSADTVVLALGLKPRTKLLEKLKGKVSELHAIGDCVEVRKIGDAVREGFFVSYGL